MTQSEIDTQAWAWQDSTATAPDSGTFAANGSFSDNLAFADREKERTFVESITSGSANNQIVAGVETALSCMLGRMAGPAQVRCDQRRLCDRS
jgi:hypothetical protein